MPVKRGGLLRIGVENAARRREPFNLGGSVIKSIVEPFNLGDVVNVKASVIEPFDFGAHVHASVVEPFNLGANVKKSVIEPFDLGSTGGERGGTGTIGTVTGGGPAPAAPLMGWWDR